MSRYLTKKDLMLIANMASNLDKTGDPVLMKEASVLDQILLTIGANKSEVTAAKNAQDIEIEKIKSQNDPYQISKIEHDKQNKVEATREALDKIREYRIMEAPLNTRTCPDHPGAQMARISDHTYQCSLDKGIYNYEAGYTTMKGNKIPGGNVTNQTSDDRRNEFTSFETRENKLNSF